MKSQKEINIKTLLEISTEEKILLREALIKIAADDFFSDAEANVMRSLVAELDMTSSETAMLERFIRKSHISNKS